LTFRIPSIDEEALGAARLRQAALTKPPGSLGRLEEVALQLAAFQGVALPRAVPACALFAADHPVTHHGISPYPAAVTRAMVHNFVEGGAAASILCKTWGIPLWVVDVGVDEPADPRTAAGSRSSSVRLLRHAVANLRAGDLRVEDAMSPEVFDGCLKAGRETVEELPRDTTVLVVGDMGIGNTTVASCLVAALVGGDPALWVGAGTGADDAMRAIKVEVCRDALARVAGVREPRELLRRVGGREVAAMYGAMAAALERRITVLVDGFIATSAALVLCTEEPTAKAGLLWAHRSAERAHASLLEHLGVRALLDLGLRLGEGSGALVAYPLVASACALHSDMATFESAGVPDKSEQRDTVNDLPSRR
jgi:nicotinate-nucleotide--dimethylbenzimidazole phosphoribosyltransferase